MARMDRYRDDYKPPQAQEVPEIKFEETPQNVETPHEEFMPEEFKSEAKQEDSSTTIEELIANNPELKEELNYDYKDQPKKKKKGKGVLIVFIILLVGVAGFLAYQYFGPLKLKGPAEMVVYQGEEYVEQGTNSIFAKVSGKVNTKVLGDYTLTYTVGKQSVKRLVHVVDINRLVLGLKGCENTVVRQGDPYIESGAYAIDKESGIVQDKKIKIKSNVNTSKPGKYSVTYTVNSGLVKKKIVRKVQVIATNDFVANTEGIPVLMYHYIYTAEDKPSDLNVNYTINTDFEAQLKYLTENGYYYPSFDELRAYVDGKIALPEKSVILTFDDAQYGFFNYGKALLEQYKVPATSFVIGVQDGANKVRVNASQYIQFQSHSYDMHKGGGNKGHGGVITSMTKAQIVEDLKKSFEIVGNTDALAYPYGDYNDTALEAVAEAGLDVAFTTEGGKVKVGADYRKLPRVRVSGGNSLEDWIESLK